MNMFVISDIHGELLKFEKMLELINFNKKDKLIILGDNIDRGPHGLQLVLRIKELKDKGFDIITLMGNHEQMFLDEVKYYNSSVESCLYELHNNRLNMSNDTYETLLQYFDLSHKERITVINEIRDYKYYYIQDSFLCVHAGIYPFVSIDKQEPEDLIWIRDIFFNNLHGLPFTVIFGHTPTRILNNDNSDKIWYGEDKIGIDCGCVFGGKLGCLEVNSMKEYYV